MDEMMRTGLGLLGGLALFLYGMNLMSGSLQEAAGERMRSVLAAVGRNPVVGVVAGALATAVLQSSSATTVMVIGFVSAGLMRLPQAVPLIMGANIGTTITAQILAFKLSDYVLAIVFAGFVAMSLARREKAKLGGRALFGFGLLFLGIGTMGDALKPLASDPLFTDMITQVTGVPVLGVAVGTLMTLVVQSSSATIAVLQNLASQPGPDGASLIGLEGAIPFLLGDNLGTTITALLAAAGQSRDAKRVALSHCLFNLSGCLLFVWIIGPFAALVAAVPPAGPELEVIARQIANAHTLFNVAMTALWLPCVPLMVRMVMALLPDRPPRPRDPLAARDPLPGGMAA
ncbi:MAG: Na/Pi cotransporter family protein [Eggerthellaceae bacterium]|nr:Na/Pi cotransporter family protein [Eggerthellaceae bacterium]